MNLKELCDEIMEHPLYEQPDAELEGAGAYIRVECLELRALVAAARLALTWISVGERLPERLSETDPTSRHVQVAQEDDVPRTAFYDHGEPGWNVDRDRGPYRPRVTHWRELPAPPEKA